MKINNVTITEKELCRAVELYLATQGISLPVESAEKRYSYGSYTIKFVDTEDTLPNPAKTPANDDLLVVSPKPILAPWR